MQPEDMYVLTADGSPLEIPLQKPYPAKKVKCSDCHPLFLEVCNVCISPSPRLCGPALSLLVLVLHYDSTFV